MALYLCDRRKNAGCRGTACFYDGVTPLCFATNDPACAVTDADGEPIRVTGRRKDAIMGDEGRFEHAQAANDSGPAGDI